MPNTWLDNPLKLLIVEDHEFTRTGLKYSLQGYYNVTIVGEAGDGNTSIELAKNLQPDMILMDIGMPKWMVSLPRKKLNACCPISKLLC